MGRTRSKSIYTKSIFSRKHSTLELLEATSFFINIVHLKQYHVWTLKITFWLSLLTRIMKQHHRYSNQWGSKTIKHMKRDRHKCTWFTPSWGYVHQTIQNSINPFNPGLQNSSCDTASFPQNLISRSKPELAKYSYHK